MVARVYDISALSRPASSLRLTESFTSSAPRSAYIFSRLPYLCSSSMAVFSPTPGTPGILSEASPMSALRSTM